jgi:hypothetical protein
MTLLTQTFPCSNRRFLHSPFKQLPKCCDCIFRSGTSRSAKGSCRFNGTRSPVMLLKYCPTWPGTTGSRTIDLTTTPPSVSFVYKAEESPRFPRVFNRVITQEDIELKKVSNHQTEQNISELSWYSRLGVLNCSSLYSWKSASTP